MNLTYQNVAFHDLGEIRVKQSRDYEGGDAPQRCKVTLTVTLEVFEQDYAANRSLLEQARTALRTQNGLLQWQNEVTGEYYVNQVVTLVSEELPEDWGEYTQTLELVFCYYEHNLTTSNLPLTFKRDDAQAALPFPRVLKITESGDIERFNAKRKHRKESRGKVTVKGFLPADPTQSVSQQRTALLAALTNYRAQMNGAEGRLQFGTSGNYVIDRVVRVESFTAELDQLLNQINFEFTAGYTLFPNEAGYAVVEYTADQKDDYSGEELLTVAGKISASTETAARTKLAALTTAVLTQYGFTAAQPQRLDTTASQVDADADGTTFVELNFSGEWRRWRDSNQQLTFKRQGSTGQPVDFGKVKLFDFDYTAKRFNDQRSQRESAGGRAEAMGTWPADPALSLEQKRTALAAKLTQIKTEVDSADGTMVYGGFFGAGQTVRVENLKAKINQAETGIDWSFTAVWSVFPNEGNYATVKFSVEQSETIEDGDERLVLSGTIAAPSGVTARAKLDSLRTSVLAIYGYNLNQRLRASTTPSAVDANGDKTSGVAEGLEAATTDGVTILELAFTEEYRRRKANLIGATWQRQQRSDVTTQTTATVYSGSVTASGADADAAYALAKAKAESIGRNKEGVIGNLAFLKNETLGEERRQTRTENAVELVRLTFSYEYQSKLAVGQAYLEVTEAVQRDTFGQDLDSVTGFVVARTEAEAEDIYFSQVRDAYAGRLIRNEQTGAQRVQAEQANSSFTEQHSRFDFSLQVFRSKQGGQTAIKYSIAVARNFATGEQNSTVRGSVFAVTRGAAEAMLTAFLGDLGLGSPVLEELVEDREWTEEGPDDADTAPGLFVKLDFTAQYSGKLTGVSGLYEMKVTVDTTYSGTRWVGQPLPFVADPPADFDPHNPPANLGGVTIVQPTGLESGSRTVTGSVSAGTLAAAEAWAKAQRALLTGDADGNHYEQPEKWTRGYELVPRTQGIVTGANPDVRIYRVDFTFAELLPKYPRPA